MQWETSRAPVPYEDALKRMESHVAAMREGKADELGWILEHPPLYTLGTSADQADVLSKDFPIYETGRGGQVTYHGPGQRIAYMMLDLNKRGKDVRAYVQNLEGWIIRVLDHFGVEGFTREGRIGVWTNTPAGEKKIAALGVRVQGWVTSHGIALNWKPDLSHYKGIVPCGIREYGVTSLEELGFTASQQEVDDALTTCFTLQFGES